MTDVRMTQCPILRRGSSVAMNVMNPGNIDAQPTAEMMMLIPGRRQKKIRGRERGKKRKPHVIGRGLRAVGKQEAGAPAARKARSTRGRPPRARSAPRPWPSTCWHSHPPVRGLGLATTRHRQGSPRHHRAGLGSSAGIHTYIIRPWARTSALAAARRRLAGVEGAPRAAEAQGGGAGDEAGLRASTSAASGSGRR